MSRSPFPGMDPYLESPDLWPDVHESLISLFREQLTPLLVPKYVATLETQLVIDQISENSSAAVPDVMIAETGRDSSVDDTDTAVAIAPAPVRLRIPRIVPVRVTTLHIKRVEGDKLVTVLELLSPVNKRAGDGRKKYLKKRNAFFDSDVHLMEIDLLRLGPRMPFWEEVVPDSDYLAMVSRADERPVCEVWPLKLRQPLPVLPVPLRRPDADVPLDIGQALRTAYERARYDLRINYNKPPIPPLKKVDATWAATLVS
ncbi:MAG: hypothetical protein DRR08_11840 [Candidatus Parabeggiatoa sp. nov. 2]|nr:MAG: hypothetical protein B6247_08650 [Beggiatoa sp. 4572_84]RKZ60254.1 MAG: hypothetical protein DRR08_11840 [Gammaproteobacteria bacterium]